MRLVFAGSSPFAIPTLAALNQAGATIIAVYTRPPRRAGRGMKSGLDPIADYALAHGLPLRMPPGLKPVEPEQVFFAAADLAIIVSYGVLIPSLLFTAPRFGSINLHPSLLPRWRGAAPIERALMAGDRETGLTLIRLTEKLDCGPILAQQKMTLDPQIRAGELRGELAQHGAEFIVDNLAALHHLTEIPQDHDSATYAARIVPEDGRIDWHRSALDLHNLVRGLSPRPGAWFDAMLTANARSGKPDRATMRPSRLRILRSRVVDHTATATDLAAGTLLSGADLRIRCATGILELCEIQRDGGKPMDAAAFLRGHQIVPLAGTDTAAMVGDDGFEPPTSSM